MMCWLESVAVALVALVAITISACGSGSDKSSRADRGHGALVNPAENKLVSHDTQCADPFDGTTPSFDTTGWKTNFCVHSVPFTDIMSGGPPRDGIPPIDDPSFVSTTSADEWLRDVEPVIALEVAGKVRAYPLQVLMWHEVVNDELAGTPIAVTFCPLCYAAIAFRRPTVDDQVLTFGTSGSLRNSDLVMWDRQTESWWQQFSGEAIIGTLTGSVLEQIPAAIVSWRDFKQAYPSGEVLSRETGHDRPYGANPYAGYDDIDKRPFAYFGDVGDELSPMAHVVGVRLGDSARAYSLERLAADGVINDSIDGRKIAVFWVPGTASALDDEVIANSRDIGATGVFDRVLGKHTLEFDVSNGGLVDRGTGSRWNVLGHATEGPLAGSALTRIAHHDVFWFTWSAFMPSGTLYE